MRLLYVTLLALDILKGCALISWRAHESWGEATVESNQNWRAHLAPRLIRSAPAEHAANKVRGKHVQAPAQEPAAAQNSPPTVEAAAASAGTQPAAATAAGTASNASNASVAAPAAANATVARVEAVAQQETNTTTEAANESVANVTDLAQPAANATVAAAPTEALAGAANATGNLTAQNVTADAVANTTRETVATADATNVTAGSAENASIQAQQTNGSTVTAEGNVTPPALPPTRVNATPTTPGKVIRGFTPGEATMNQTAATNITNPEAEAAGMPNTLNMHAEFELVGAGGSCDAPFVPIPSPEVCAAAKDFFCPGDICKLGQTANYADKPSGCFREGMTVTFNSQIEWTENGCTECETYCYNPDPLHSETPAETTAATSESTAAGGTSATTAEADTDDPITAAAEADTATEKKDEAAEQAAADAAAADIARP